MFIVIYYWTIYDLHFIGRCPMLNATRPLVLGGWGRNIFRSYMRSLVTCLFVHSLYNAFRGQMLCGRGKKKVKTYEERFLLFYGVTRLAKRRWLSFMTSFVRNGQFRSTFRTPGSQYLAAVGGSHSFTEAVFISSFSLRGLIRSFHCSSYLLACYFIQFL